jgi:hypothetical protein
MRSLTASLALAATCAVSAPAAAQENRDTLARQLSNPIASLISVPLQLNADFGVGADGDGTYYTLNIQPVIPVRLNDDWNLISRTVLPIASREGAVFGDGVTGVGDTLQSFFFSPAQPGPHGLIWGVGPAFLLPTASDERLGGEKWGGGPTVVALTQNGPWTTGVLANHIWSFAGDDERADVSTSFVQPFAGYALGSGRTISAGLEASYDWNAEQWTAPASLSFSQILPVGKQLISVQVGARYYLDAPPNGPEWGLRTTLTFLFPRR